MQQRVLSILLPVLSVVNGLHYWNNAYGYNTIGNSIIANNMLGLGAATATDNNLLGNNMWNDNQLSRMLLTGKYLMRLQPGDSMYMANYLGLWGASQETIDKMKHHHPPMMISISEDGNSITMTHMMEGGDNWEATMRFGQSSTMVHPLIGKEVTCTVYMTSPSSFTVESTVNETGLQDIQTFTFNQFGVQVSISKEDVCVLRLLPSR